MPCSCGCRCGQGPTENPRKVATGLFCRPGLLPWPPPLKNLVPAARQGASYAVLGSRRSRRRPSLSASAGGRAACAWRRGHLISERPTDVRGSNPDEVAGGGLRWRQGSWARRRDWLALVSRSVRVSDPDEVFAGVFCRQGFGAGGAAGGLPEGRAQELGQAAGSAAAHHFVVQCRLTYSTESNVWIPADESGAATFERACRQANPSQHCQMRRKCRPGRAALPF